MFPPRPKLALRQQNLRFQYRDDLVCARIDNHDLVTDEDVVVAAPLGVDHEDFLRQRIEVDAAIGNAGADADRDVQLRRFDTLHLLLLDDGGDLGALLRRKLLATMNVGAGVHAFLSWPKLTV